MRFDRNIRGRRPFLALYLVCVIATVTEAGSVRIDQIRSGQTGVGPGFLFTLDGSRVLYRQRVDGVTRLFSVPVGGGPSTELTFPEDGMRDVHEQLRLSPDGKYVVYLRENESGQRERRQLYAARVDGSTSRRVSDPPGGVERLRVAISPDSTHVAYVGVGRSDFDVWSQLYIAPLESGPPLLLSPDPVNYGSWANDVVFVRGGTAVVHLTAPKSSSSTAPLKLWALSIDGQTQTLLAQELSGQRDPEYSGYVPLPGGDEVLVSTHLTQARGGGSYEWYKVPVNGDPAELLTQPEFDLNTSMGQLTPDGQEFVLLQQEPDTGRNQLWSYRISDSHGTRLVPEEARIDEIEYMHISPTGDRVVFGNYNEPGTPQKFYSVPIHGGEVTQLVEINSYQATSQAELFDVTSDGEYVVFTADMDQSGVLNLYSVPTEGGPMVQLNPPSPPFGRVSTFYLTPDGRRVIYTANHAGVGRRDVYSVPIGGGTAHMISGRPPENGWLASFGNYLIIDPNSTVAVFLVADRDPGSSQLRMAPVVPGDVNLDGDLNALDLDLLAWTIRQSSRIAAVRHG